MDHAEAIRVNATEQYLLGELQGEVLEEFEEHYFSCAVCAQDVKAGMAMMASGKEVARTDRLMMRKKPEQAAAAGWFAWLKPAFAVPALAALLLIVGYQNIFSVPKLEQRAAKAEQPKVVRSFPLAALRSRGGEEKALSVTPGDGVDLVMDVPVNSFKAYTCGLESQSGRTLYTIPSCGEYDRNTIEISIPAGSLASGHYILVVTGSEGEGPAAAPGTNGSEIIRQAFSLEMKR